MTTGKPCRRLGRPWLWLPSQLSHDLSPYLLPLMAPLFAPASCEFRPWLWRNLKFRNPLGIAGGVDKTGASLKYWQNLGAGFVEVGTITPRAQGPNPGKIMDRDLTSWGLWNKMGFPNSGVEQLVFNLNQFAKNKKVPLFINIGKNRDTANESAHVDYITCLEKLHEFADVFVVNVSSPNTRGLRDLQSKENFINFLQPIVRRRNELCPQIPLLLKISPDLSEHEISQLVADSTEFVDGWILTNTTQSREQGSKFPAEGGVSGLPLQELSREKLKCLIKALGENSGDKLVVSVGGIISADEVRLRLQMGAHLVQTYSGLVFGGPGFFKNTLNSLRS